MNIAELTKGVYTNGSNELTSRIKIAIDEVEDNQEVLEIGVGFGELSKNIHRFKKVRLSAVDIAQSPLENVRKYTVDSQLADISSVPLKFPDNRFDVVFCLEVFEHLQNPNFALSEIQRVLKPRGKLVLSIPNYWGGHLMIYPGLITPKFFKYFLEQNYFKVSRFLMWGPVLNKDNIGTLLRFKFGNGIMTSIVLRTVQISVRLLQMFTKILFLKLPALYWCYFFICENRKGEMDSPVWVRQWEQTSQLKGDLGWYNHYFHRKPR